MHTQRKGATLPLLAVMMMALILVLGLMVEITWLHATRFEAQSASDLSARSALARLYANTEQLDQIAVDDAKQVGLDVYASNFPAGPITADQLEFGRTENDDSFQAFTNPNQFREITATRVDYDQSFNSLLGSIVVKNDVNIPGFSVAESNRIELVLCLDASRSMNRSADPADGEYPPGGKLHALPLPGSRWFALADTVESFVNRFASQESHLGLVTFGGGFPDHPQFVSPIVDGTKSRREVELDTFASSGPAVIETMEEYGEAGLGYGTSIYDGLNEAISLLETSTIPARQQYVILLTDGRQVFPDVPSELVAGQNAADENIIVFTIGYGAAVNSLKKIADMTGGESFTADNDKELQAVFDTISSTLRVSVTQ